MSLNISTYFTLFRIIIIPFFIITFYLPYKLAPLYCIIFFILASVTDWIDGFLARYFQQITQFGMFLDPVADKLIVVIALILVTEHFHSLWITLPAIIIIIREIFISALREWMAIIGKKNKIIVYWVSKIKTTIQMISLSILLYRPNNIILIIGIITLYIATIVTFYSLFQYIYAIRNELSKS